jgi:hypothetical protein
MKKILLLMMYCPLMLSAQTGSNNGVTVTGLNVEPGTITFNVSWQQPMPAEPWSDTVWVFVEYNNADRMERLPVTNATVSAGTVEIISGNSKGVRVIGNARTEGSFSATVQLLTEAADLSGVCAYASNYPPVGNYTSEMQLVFTGTPPYEIVLKHESGTTITQSSNLGNYLVPENYTLQLFTDATGAPGIFSCKMPAKQTLIASAEGYCDNAAGVLFALTNTERGAVYQLYQNDVLLPDAILTGNGGAASFSGTFPEGVYRVKILPGSFCPAVMNGAQVVHKYPVPEHPIVIGPNQACDSAILTAAPGLYGQFVRWQDDENLTYARTVKTTDTYTAISLSQYGCTSVPHEHVVQIRTGALSGAVSDQLCGCIDCLIINASGRCEEAPTHSNVYEDRTINGDWYPCQGQTGTVPWVGMDFSQCKTTSNCLDLAIARANDINSGSKLNNWILCKDATCSTFYTTTFCGSCKVKSRCWLVD